MAVDLAEPPETGVWRIGRGPDPLATQPALPPTDLDRRDVGNRFDSPLGTYQVLYFGSTLRACFAETLARFRPDLDILEMIRREWADLGFMEVGAVPADWRLRRLAVRARFPEALPFVDVAGAGTIRHLRKELSDVLRVLGYQDFDLSVATGPDRRVTRWISWWVHEARDEDGDYLYAGVRYPSRFGGDYECWAVFDDTPLEELEVNSISRNDPGLEGVAAAYDLRVF